MSQPTYAFNPQDLVDGENALVTAFEQVRDALDQLERRAEAALATWSGRDQAQYWIHKAHWNQAMDRISTVLVSTAAPAVRNSLENYLQNEEMQMKRWGLNN